MFLLVLFFLYCLIDLLLKVIAKLPELSNEVWTPLYSPLFFLQRAPGIPVCHIFIELQNQLIRTQEKKMGICVWNLVKWIISLREIRQFMMVSLPIQARFPYICSSLFLCPLVMFSFYSHRIWIFLSKYPYNHYFFVIFWGLPFHYIPQPTVVCIYRSTLLCASIYT